MAEQDGVPEATGRRRFGCGDLLKWILAGWLVCELLGDSSRERPLALRWCVAIGAGILALVVLYLLPGLLDMVAKTPEPTDPRFRRLAPRLFLADLILSVAIAAALYGFGYLIVR